MNEHVLSGLVKRRAQLAGNIELTHKALRKMVLDLERPPRLSPANEKTARA
jgi:hypothetical protein